MWAPDQSFHSQTFVQWLLEHEKVFSFSVEQYISDNETTKTLLTFDYSAWTTLAMQYLHYLHCYTCTTYNVILASPI